MKKRILAACLSLCLLAVGLLPLAARAAGGDPRVEDSAGLLTEKQERKLTKKLNKLSEKLEFDIVVATTDSLDGKTATEYADDLYDSRDWGWGEDRDGILLLVSPQERDYAISTCGSGIDAIRPGARAAFEGKFLKQLGKDNYYKAFRIYADQSEKFYSQALDGKPYDSDFLPPKMGYVVFFSLLIGCLGSLVLTLREKNALKSVRLQTGAAAYGVGGVQLTGQQDQFLRTYQTSYQLPDNDSDSGSGGSSSHKSSSGTSHGGWSGKY